MKIVRNILVWVLIVLYIVFAMGFVREKRGEILCHDIEVEILDSIINGFITESDIKDFFHESDMHIIGSPVTSINSKVLELKLKQYSSVKNAEVYVTLEGDIRVEIDQRNPILRVINKRGQSYYIDQEGTIMPLSSKYSSHVLIANGNIIEHYEVNRTRDFASGFAESLEFLDEIILLDIYPAREEPIPGVTSELIFNKIRNSNKTLCKKVELLELLKDKDPEVLMTLGAGDIDELVEPIKKLFKKG